MINTELQTLEMLMGLLMDKVTCWLILSQPTNNSDILEANDG